MNVLRLEKYYVMSLKLENSCRCVFGGRLLTKGYAVPSKADKGISW